MPRVLVIDDQADVRIMVSIVLRIHRYDVVEAASATEGLRAFEADTFDLVIVDVFLQDTSGIDVITQMRERVPDLPAVAISGMTALDFVNHAPGLTGVVGMQKPFRPKDLMAAIAQACSAVRPPAAELKAG